MRAPVCVNCGARLPVVPPGAVVRCAFCGTEGREDAPGTSVGDGVVAPNRPGRALVIALVAPLVLAVLVALIATRCTAEPRAPEAPAVPSR